MITFLQLVAASIIGNYIAMFLVMKTTDKVEKEEVTMQDVQVTNKEDIELLKKIIERNKK